MNSVLVTRQWCLVGGWLRLFGVAVIACGVFTIRAEEEITIGRSAAGQLKLQLEFEQPLGLPVSVFPGMPGYATGEMGVHSAAVDEPANDFYQLSPAVDLRLVLLAKDAGMEVWNDHGSAYMAIGEMFFIGSAPFDTHPVWDLVSGTPGNNYSLTVKVADLAGIYSESEPQTLSFTPNPPVLTIASAGPGFVTISWTPSTSGFVLQMTPDVEAAAWTNAPSGPTNPVTLAVSPGANFFRVSR